MTPQEQKVAKAIEGLLEACQQGNIDTLDVLIGVMSDIIAADEINPYRLLAIITHRLQDCAGSTIDERIEQNAKKKKRPDLRIIKTEGGRLQ